MTLTDLEALRGGLLLASFANRLQVPMDQRSRFQVLEIYDAGERLGSFTSASKFFCICSGLCETVLDATPRDFGFPCLLPHPPDGTVLRILEMRIYPRQEGKAARRRPSLGDSPWQKAACGVVTWRSGWGQRRAIEYDGDPTDDEVLKAKAQLARAIHAVRPGPIAGDPANYWRYAPDEADKFRVDVEKWVTLVMSDGDRVSIRSVAKKAGIDRGTLANYLRQFSVNLTSVATDLKYGGNYPAKLRHSA